MRGGLGTYRLLPPRNIVERIVWSELFGARGCWQGVVEGGVGDRTVMKWNKIESDGFQKVYVFGNFVVE